MRPRSLKYVSGELGISSQIVMASEIARAIAPEASGMTAWERLGYGLSSPLAHVGEPSGSARLTPSLLAAAARLRPQSQHTIELVLAHSDCVVVPVDRRQCVGQ